MKYNSILWDPVKWIKTKRVSTESNRIQLWWTIGLLIPAVNSMLRPRFFLTCWSTERSHATPAAEKLDPNLSWSKVPQLTDFIGAGLRPHCLEWICRMLIWSGAYDHMTMSIFYTCYMSSGPPSPHTGCTPQVSLQCSKGRCEPGPALSSLCNFYPRCCNVLEPKLRGVESGGVLFQTAANCCVSRICAHIYRHATWIVDNKRVYSSPGPFDQDWTKKLYDERRRIYHMYQNLRHGDLR